MAEVKTYIYRMTHYSNLEFIINNGLHCCNCGTQDPNYTNIGFKTLIDNRGKSTVPIAPGGVLNDYIPFYFHYKMPMLYNIWKKEVLDYRGDQNEIIYLVSSVEQMDLLGLPYVFTDRHAYVAYKAFFNQYADLKNLEWGVIKDHSWYLEYSQQRKELKQAEFLIYQHLPANGILGMVVQNEEIATFVKTKLQTANSKIKVITKPEYYYS